MAVSSYLTDQIIAYIGNKRRLLELISHGIELSLPRRKGGERFADLFSGSGVVSRLAKTLDFEVLTNDWEDYAHILNLGYIKTNREDIAALFGSEKSFQDLLNEINHLPHVPKEEEYIARYYSTASPDWEKADFRTERLFYTRENGLIIDRIRSFLDKEYDKGDPRQNLLLSMLLYESATHTNTSGVFKAYHKGFGGHGQDAMKRILTPIHLKMPPLINSRRTISVYKEDVNDLVKKKEGRALDIAYLDPPYNQHQYGSNYHLLNTIALWDKVPAPLDLNEKGELCHKGAIRKDWIRTRSEYCYREKAVDSFSRLIEDLDARIILISYSTDGIIPFDVMKDICRGKGKISLVSNEYTRYRGGKQSNSRVNRNVEFVLTLECGKKTSRNGLREIDMLIARKRARLLFKQKYSRRRLEEYGRPRGIRLGDKGITYPWKGTFFLIRSKDFFTLSPPDEIELLSFSELKQLCDFLEKTICISKVDELEEIFIQIEKGEGTHIIKLIPPILNKLAHKKNRDLFTLWVKKTKELSPAYPQLYKRIGHKINAIEEIAQKRFLG